MQGECWREQRRLFLGNGLKSTVPEQWSEINCSRAVVWNQLFQSSGLKSPKISLKHTRTAKFCRLSKFHIMKNKTTTENAWFWTTSWRSPHSRGRQKRAAVTTCRGRLLDSCECSSRASKTTLEIFQLQTQYPPRHHALPELLAAFFQRLLTLLLCDDLGVSAAVWGVHYVFQVEGFLGKESKSYQAIPTW